MLLYEAPIRVPLKIFSLRESDLSMRLADMGFNPGATIAILQKSTLNGNVIIHLGTSLVGLRKAEAKLIHVELA